MEKREIEKELSKVLKKSRYEHTIGVAYTAQCLGMVHQVDLNKAAYAGLLHDCGKYMDGKALLDFCRLNHIPCTDTEEKNPSLLHAKAGAFLAREKYRVEEEDVLEAIRWHTTGKPDMTMLEKIIFVADYIEPGRKPLPGIDRIRRESFCDIDKAVYLILDSTLNYLKSQSSEENLIDGHSREAYLYYKEKFL